MSNRTPAPGDAADVNPRAEQSSAGSGDFDETRVGQPDDPRAATEMSAAHPETDGDPQAPTNVGAASAGAATSSDLTGTRLGDFLLEKRLGKGGMGEVFLATQVSLDRKVAVKTLSKELASRPDFVQRFLRESRSMARLHHPNIVQVFAADSRDAVNFVAIEFVDGRSLQDWMDELGKLSIGDALHVTLVCCEGLRHALSKRMIHRDIKPDNILITSDGIVKLADFGLAKALDDDQSLTQTGAGMGTPLYMAPEQARSAKHVDHRSDVFALGVMLYYGVTGELPFQGATLVEIIESKEAGRYKPPRTVNPEVPERLDLVIGKMIAPNVEHRYEDYVSLIADLNSLDAHNESLSFVTAEEKAVIGRSNTVSQGHLSGRVITSRRSRVLTSVEDAKRRERETLSKADRTWLVKHASATGKAVVTKMSTRKIQEGIKNGFLDLKAKAKKSKQGDFLPLAQYREFEDLMTKRVAAVEAEAKKKNLEGLYAQAMRGQRWRNFVRRVKGFFGSVTSTILFFVYVGCIAAAVYGIVFYGYPWLRDLVADQFNLR